MCTAARAENARMMTAPTDRPPGPAGARLASALPDFALGIVYLVAWVDPAMFPAATERWLVGIMLLEFIVIHSSAFMGRVAFGDGARGRRAVALVGVGLFYTIFAGGMALALHATWPLVSFWMLTLNRMAFVLLDRASEAEQRITIESGWAASAVAYLAFGGLTIVPFLPRLGWTPGAVAALEMPGGGLWVEQPWRPLAFGAMYYIAIGFAELNGYAAFRSGVPSAIEARARRQRGGRPADDASEGADAAPGRSGRAA